MKKRLVSLLLTLALLVLPVVSAGAAQPDPTPRRPDGTAEAAPAPSIPTLPWATAS